MSPDSTPIPGGYKRCSKCVEVKPLSDFHINKRSPDSRHSVCAVCVNARKRKQYSDNIAQHAERVARYRIAHAQWYVDYRQRYYLENREQILKHQHQHYTNNAARVLARGKRWRDNNPERCRQYAFLNRYRRKARKMQLPSTFTGADWDICVAYWKGSCAYCGAQGEEVNPIQADHFIPLSSPNCPGHTRSNIVVACRRCNSSKRDCIPTDWAIKKFGKQEAERILSDIQTFFDWISLQENK